MIKKLLNKLWFKMTHKCVFEEELEYWLTRRGIGTYNYKMKLKTCQICDKIEREIYEPNFSKKPLHNKKK